MSRGFVLNKENGYFQNKGVDVMAFDDFYRISHQSGVSIIMHGNRVASCGDLRFMPNTSLARHWDWDPEPTQSERVFDETENSITTELGFPKFEEHIDGNKFDFELKYKIKVKSVGDSVVVSVDLGTPLPEGFPGRLCFYLELYPTVLFGKPWIMDNKQGIFPPQANGPTYAKPDKNQIGSIYNEPYAVGKRLTIRPDDPYNLLTIVSKGAELNLIDGRMSEGNGWYIVCSEVTPGATENAVEWIITPNAVEEWMYTPVIQTSQVGYHPNQPKVAVIELDKRETTRQVPVLYRITETGITEVLSANVQEWGQFLRYSYVKFDFTDVQEEGLYKIKYGCAETTIFRIAADIYDRGVWQPVLEYFLPIQMCHMRINENARVWHDFCHDDDAQMAPVNHVHFDMYEQGPSTLTKYKPGDVVPGLNIGGWHDAGDDDLRIESQATECYILAMMYEMFGLNHDVTTVDQDKKITEIHKPDGKNDVLQQIEHGALSIIGAYRALGRLYRGIITNDPFQYAMLGDPAAQTDGITGNTDDRWVFTEDNPPRELTTAAQLAAISRVLKGFNDELSSHALEAATELYYVTDIIKEYKKSPWLKKYNLDFSRLAKVYAAVELYITTGEGEYKNYLLSETEFIVSNIIHVGWFLGRAEKLINDADFTKAVRESLPTLKAHLEERNAETPYGIPYRPHIWGAGWEIQREGYEYYFLHNAYPDIFGPDMVFDALNFILGCHPGSNNMSFASGIGAKSALIAYGWNRADWSYAPGGVISGTALIRPDFPELLEYPFLWQQTEYVMGGGSTHYMFLVLAAIKILNGGL
ncbi:MAG: glycoside hydrolase family 9 protein [Oscillospiraceae bacterium]|nr:glycoside hydrolase family 9 protein [Oscillospiraceae bacterium]